MDIYIRITVQIHRKKLNVQCSGGPQDHPHVQWLACRTHRTQRVVVLTTVTCYSGRIQSTISKGKRNMEWSKEETRLKLPRVLFQCGITHDMFNFSKQILAIYVKCCLPGTTLETQCPRVLLGDFHIRTLCLACTKLPEFQERNYLA